MTMAPASRLDLADDDEEPCERGERHTLEAVGAVLGLTRERARQIEAVAIAKFRAALELDELLGPELAAEVYEELRGKPVHVYETAVERARAVALPIAVPASSQTTAP